MKKRTFWKRILIFIGIRSTCCGDRIQVWYGGDKLYCDTCDRELWVEAGMME